MARPERRKTKKVKDQKLVESVAAPVESVIKESELDSNIIDKGFFLEDKEAEGFKGVGELPCSEVVDVKEEAHLSQSDVQAIQFKYENKLKILEEENQRLKNDITPLSKNEEKLLSAIRSERINQSVEEPIIGRSMLIRKYKMNSKYLDDSIKGLEERKILERREVPYSAKIMTNSWKLLKR